MSEKRFNVRVYGLIIHNEAILITDEHRGSMHMSKFPGGGLEWGEGVADCLRRECMEEMGQEPIAMEHYYTTDFFVASAFRGDDQMISIYYLVTLPHPDKIETVSERFAFGKIEDGAQTFRWIPLSEFSEEEVTFPIDKNVARMMRR